MWRDGPGHASVRSVTLFGVIGLALVAGAMHCSLLASSDLKAGIGQACGRDDECQNAFCEESVCATACVSDRDCPSPSLCVASRCRVACHADADCKSGELCVGDACAPPLRVGAVLPGSSAGNEDGWSASQVAGLEQAAGALPYMRAGTGRYEVHEGARTAEETKIAIDQFINEGMDVILTASPIGNDAALARAATASNVKFFLAGGATNDNLPNAGAYRGKAEQTWFVAGKLAAREASAGASCVGIVLPTPTKEIIRDTNAFVRGARSQQPDVKVVIRWLGATKDFAESAQYTYSPKTYALGSQKMYREELLAAQIADLGCSLVAHRTETQRVVIAVGKTLRDPVKAAMGHELFSLGSGVRDACNPDGTSDPRYATCLGSVYWHWGGLYTRLFDQVRRGLWTAGIDVEAFRVDADAVSQLALSANVSVSNISQEQVTNALQLAADDGYDAVFAGPYSFNGQRDLNRDGVADASQALGKGEVLSDDELERMCWFVEGTYELPDWSDVRYGALIPALVPYGPPVKGGTTVLDGSDASRKKYGDVIDYLSTIQRNPAQAMSCALN